MKWSDLCLVPVLVFAVVGSGCHSEPESTGGPISKNGEGREETRSIRSAENIGFAGDAVADKIDRALDAAERRGKDLNDELDSFN